MTALHSCTQSCSKKRYQHNIGSLYRYKILQYRSKVCICDMCTREEIWPARYGDTDGLSICLIYPDDDMTYNQTPLQIPVSIGVTMASASMTIASNGTTMNSNSTSDDWHTAHSERQPGTVLVPASQLPSNKPVPAFESWANQDDIGRTSSSEWTKIKGKHCSSCKCGTAASNSSYSSLRPIMIGSPRTILTT